MGLSQTKRLIKMYHAERKEQHISPTLLSSNSAGWSYVIPSFFYFYTIKLDLKPLYPHR